MLETIAAAREREHEFLALCDDSPPPEPGVWTVKDHLAHLTAWRINVARLLDAGRTGTEAPTMDDDVEGSNARIYAANRDKTADEVKANARSAYDTLEAAIAACSDEDLVKPHPAAIPGRGPLADGPGPCSPRCRAFDVLAPRAG